MLDNAIEQVLTTSTLTMASDWSIFHRLAKLTEEVGELAEATIHHHGCSPHKKMKEPIEGEVADVVICAIDILSQSYPELSINDLMVVLAAQLQMKNDKWRKVAGIDK